MGSPTPAQLAATPEGQQKEQDKELANLRAQLQVTQAQNANAAALAEQGLDARGLPIRPEFESLFEGDTDKLREGFQIGEFDAVDLDRRALDRITEEGLAEGPTRGGQRQLDLQGLQQSQAFDDLSRGQAGAQAQAQNALAQQGGLSGGARERLARSGQRSQLLGGQQLRGQGAQQRAGILASDEQAKRGLLGQAQQGAIGAGQFDQGNRQFEAQRRQFDISNQLGELQSKRDADLAAFEADRKAAAATKQAEAQRASACFAKGTMLPMADGTYKKIEDIKLGECLKAGGNIHLILSSSLEKYTDVYNYEGVLVTGCHAVLEDGCWIRIKDSKRAVLHNEEIDIVYTLANELHLIVVAGVVFADYEETDDFHHVSDEESLALLNSKLNDKVKYSAENVTFC